MDSLIGCRLVFQATGGSGRANNEQWLVKFDKRGLVGDDGFDDAANAGRDGRIEFHHFNHAQRIPDRYCRANFDVGVFVR